MVGGRAKERPTKGISQKMPHAEQASSSRGARRLPVQRDRGEREPRKKQENKEGTKQPFNALTLPSARAEPPPGTSLPSSSVRHLTEGRSPNLPFLPSPSRLGWSHLPIPASSHTFGAWRSSKSQEQPKESNSNFERFSAISCSEPKAGRQNKAKINGLKLPYFVP